jgi:hypothetical protein
MDAKAFLLEAVSTAAFRAAPYLGFKVRISSQAMMPP